MKKIHLVSHVHWDPAWYLPYEQYRLTLLPVMRDLLQILETQPDYTSFQFDGQIDAIDDYLEMVPEDRPRIEKLVRSGRLIVGPWYIQPEEFLLTGESHIRNLLLGMKKADAYGACMPVSYLCDMVGHIAQMPQIVHGFGMDFFAGWRGITDASLRAHASMIWEAPDGSQVLLKNLTNGYYNILPKDEASFPQALDDLADKLAAYEDGDSVLVMQGADHNPAIAEIPSLIRSYNARKGTDCCVQTSLEAHMRSIDRAACPQVRGELRSYHSAFILTGILTTRMSIKLRNEEVSMGLERWAEPFSAVQSILTGAAYPKHALQYAWLKMLKCAFHDCIYGGHVDAVTPDIFNYYKRAAEISDWTSREALFGLTQAIQTVPGKDNITFFNPTPWERTNAVVHFPFALPAGTAAEGFAVVTEDGTLLPVQLHQVQRDRKSYTGFSENQWCQCDATLYDRYELSVCLPSLPALGYANYGIRVLEVSSKTPCQTSDLTLNGNVCENTYLRVVFEENGSLSVFDKVSGVYYPCLNALEESGDKGDHYNYSVPVSDQVFRDTQAETQTHIEAGIHEITFCAERRWMLPACIEADGTRSTRKVLNVVRTRASIHAFSRTIVLHTEMDNQSEDHRIRLAVSTGIAGTTVRSGSQFYVNERPRVLPEPEVYVEKPLNNQPQRLFTDLSNARSGLSVFSRGLSEYEARENGDLFLTLLRCTSHLSKPTNAERSFCNAGPEYETPLAQEKGLHVYDYAFFFHDSDASVHSILKACDEFYVLPRAMQGTEASGSLPTSCSFLRLEGEGLMLSALKQSDEGDGWILRLYNGENKPVSGRAVFAEALRSAAHTNLREQDAHSVPFEAHALPLVLGPYEISTYRIHFQGKKEICHA